MVIECPFVDLLSFRSIVRSIYCAVTLFSIDRPSDDKEREDVHGIVTSRRGG